MTNSATSVLMISGTILVAVGNSLGADSYIYIYIRYGWIAMTSVCEVRQIFGGHYFSGRRSKQDARQEGIGSFENSRNVEESKKQCNTFGGNLSFSNAWHCRWYVRQE